jgi:hypothetical protein
MDLGRGSLLAQVWTDTDWLTPPERRELGDLVALLREGAACFRGARPYLGSPWRSEPYGYACSDGKRAFLAVHNAGLEDRVVTLSLGAACGLPEGGRWDLYRWHPRPARLGGSGGPWGREARVAMRPHEVDLLEVVPAGGTPSLGRAFEDVPASTSFAEPTRELGMDLSDATPEAEGDPKWWRLRPLSASAGKARLSVREDGSVLAGGENVVGDVYVVTAESDLPGVGAVLLETLTDDSLPNRGPGRAENGNFALTGLRVLAAPKGRPDAASEVRIRGARADYSQTSHGGWPVSAAIDGDPKSGWSVFPEVGVSHAAVFDLEPPAGFPAGTFLRIELTQGERGHAVGRLRLSVATGPSPELPREYRPRRLVAETSVPGSLSGGIVLVVGEGGSATPGASLGGIDVGMVPVWSERASWPCPWRAWRLDVGPAELPRVLRVTFDGKGLGPKPPLRALFIPR